MRPVTAAAPAAPALSPFWRQFPNALTIARLVVAFAFFAMLTVYRYDPAGVSWWLFTAGWVYGVAAITDVVDGHLARKWGVTSTFGRVVDPFCDKILILGTFVFFAAPPFVVSEGGQAVSLTGVGPVVVILLLGRELLVTSLRAIAESGGTAYAAARAGKIKMFVQSFAVPVIMAYPCFRPAAEGTAALTILYVAREAAVWLTVLATLVSGALYLPRKVRD